MIRNRQDYIEKMEEIESDKTKFLPINFEAKENKELRYLWDMETAIDITLRELRDGNLITDKEYKRLSPTGSQPGVSYGCSKIHTQLVGNCPPFRPILSSINTPNYTLPKFLVPILNDITANEFSIKDSFSFVNEIRTQNSKFIMASFDVELLFSNIPLTETIQICIDELYKNSETVNGLSKHHMTKLLSLAVEKNLYNDNFYSQIKGVAMGSPLGPPLSIVFLVITKRIGITNALNNFIQTLCG